MGYHEYAEYSFVFGGLSPAEVKWLDDYLLYTIDDLDFDCENCYKYDETYKYIVRNFCDERDNGWPDFEYNFFKQFPQSEKHDAIVINAESNGAGGYEQAAKLIKTFMKAFNKDGKVTFHWVRWDNRGKDTYDGGAYCITADKIKKIKLSDWTKKNLK